MPGSHSGIICKHEYWIQAVCQGYRDLEQTQTSDVTLVRALSAVHSNLNTAKSATRVTLPFETEGKESMNE